MSPTTYTNILEVRLGGAPIPPPLAAQLKSAWVDSSLNLPSAFELTFSDPDSRLTRTHPKLEIGTKVVLTPITEGRTGEPLLTGEITALEIDAAAADGRTLRVRGYDPAHRLLRARRVAGYPNTTASDIVRTIAGLCSVTLGTIDATRTVYELATQPNITDWDFLTRLARENDVYLYADNKGRLQFTARRDATSAPSTSTSATQSPRVLEFGVNLLNCRVGVTAADQVDKVEVRGWDVKTKRAVMADPDARKSAAAVIGVTPGDVAKPFGRSELTQSRFPYTTQAQVRQAAKALAEDVADSFAEAEVVVTGTPELGPGVSVALNGGGRPFEGKYTITAARHVFTSGRQYRTVVEVTGRQVRSLYGLTSGSAADAPALPGVVNALVTNIKDPTGRLRVKLRFPWLSDTYESDWCRVAQFGGVGGGGLVLPEVDDEVLVAFDRGSLEHPYVLAGLYNGKDEPTDDPDRIPPVDKVSGKVNWRSAASRSGHLFELVDARSKAQSGIRLRTGNGALDIHLDQIQATISVESTGKVTIEGKLDVEVRAGGNLGLTAGGAVNITGGGAVSIRASGALNLNAGGPFSVNAVSAAMIRAGGVLTLQAPAVPILSALPTANGKSL